MGKGSQAQSLERFEYTRVCMGVRTHVAVFCGEKAAADEAAAAAFDRIAELDSIFSDYRADSELNRLNARAGSGPVKVSDDLFNVLRTSVAVSRASGGAFEITVGPAVALWRQSRETWKLPDAQTLERAKSLIGWQKIVINVDARTVELRMSGMKLDLGGIGKGYAAQQAVDVLKRRGLSRCLVALAGDIVVGEPPPGKTGWSIGVAERALAESDDGKASSPRPASSFREGEPSPKTHQMLLANSAVSTSGDIEQFIEIAGTRYSHLIDPRTGLGITTQRSVTAVAARGEVADALASALCVLGPNDAPGVLRAFPPSAAVFADVVGGRIVELTIDPRKELHWSP